jgi:hypothetical protein
MANDTPDTSTPLDVYLAKTGQTIQDVYAGAGQYGTGFVDSLIERAVKNNQAIIWYEDPAAAPELGLLLYRLQGL